MNSTSSCCFRDRRPTDRLNAVVPAPLEIDPREPLVKYEFIRMPDSSGFGDDIE